MTQAELQPQSSAIGRVLGHIDPDDFGDAANELLLFADCESIADVRSVLREQVEIEVDLMSNLLVDADAFDVVELMRMRAFPIVPDPRVTVPGGSALAVEIVAAILLSRPTRKPSYLPREETRPHEVIEELHSRAKRLSRLAVYRQQYEGRLSGHPLARLGAEYQASVLNVRNLQYAHVRDAHESRLFRQPIVQELMKQHLGYTYGDVVRVREALKTVSADRMTKLRDDTGDIMLRYRDVSPHEMPEEDLDKFRRSMLAFMFLPAERATIYTSEVAAAAGVEEEMASAVLNSYSQGFDATIPAGTKVFDMLTGTNPFLATPLIADGAGGFIATVNDPGLDSLRRIVEGALAPHPSDMRRYDQRARQPASESLAVESLERVLDCSAHLAGFYYYSPKQDVDVTDVGVDCVDLNGLANRVEGDGLFLVDDVAIVVEVKAKSVATQSRRGDIRRLESDLKATIGDANNQATRLQRLIETNEGIWLAPDSWMDLSHIREVRSIIVLLDDVGPLSIAIGDLQTAGILVKQRPPWIVSLHDLAVIAETCDRPGEFLLYLRRRTDSDIATLYRGTDELDFFLLFLEGGLYVADDPDAVREIHPSAPPVKPKDRRYRQESAVGAMVADHCQKLDEWYLRQQIPEGEPQPSKPTFNIAQAIEPIIDAIADRGEPGWLRCTTDLLSLAGETQIRLANAVRDCRRRTRMDGMYHDMVISSAGTWGHPTFFVGIAPDDLNVKACRKRLTQYIQAKSYQLRSDRAYGLLLDTSGTLLQFIYLTNPPLSDPELDRIVEEMRLQPVGQAHKPLPPSARRATKRLRGKKHHR